MEAGDFGLGEGLGRVRVTNSFFGVGRSVGHGEREIMRLSLRFWESIEREKGGLW